MNDKLIQKIRELQDQKLRKNKKYHKNLEFSENANTYNRGSFNGSNSTSQKVKNCDDQQSAFFKDQECADRISNLLAKKNVYILQQFDPYHSKIHQVKIDYSKALNNQTFLSRTQNQSFHRDNLQNTLSHFKHQESEKLMLDFQNTRRIQIGIQVESLDNQAYFTPQNHHRKELNNRQNNKSFKSSNTSPQASPHPSKFSLDPQQNDDTATIDSKDSYSQILRKGLNDFSSYSSFAHKKHEQQSGLLLPLNLQRPISEDLDQQKHSARSQFSQLNSGRSQNSNLSNIQHKQQDSSFNNNSLQPQNISEVFGRQIQKLSQFSSKFKQDREKNNNQSSKLALNLDQTNKIQINDYEARSQTPQYANHLQQTLIQRLKEKHKKKSSSLDRDSQAKFSKEARRPQIHLPPIHQNQATLNKDLLSKLL